MTYAPIAGIAPQYDEQDGWYLKFYNPITSTPIAMSIDAAGSTLLAKAQLDVDGFITTDGTTIFIPFLDQSYDAFLFPTATEADNNDTVNAKRVAENISPFDDVFSLDVIKIPFVVVKGQTVLNLGVTPNAINLIVDGDLQEESKDAYEYDVTLGRVTKDSPFSGGEDVEVQYGAITSASAALPVTFVVKDLVRDYGAKGNATYIYNLDGSVFVTGGDDDTQPLLNAMIDFASGAIGALTVPNGNFWIDSSQIDTPTYTNIIGAGADATNFIMSTTDTSLNLFVGFYDGSRVNNISFSGFKIIGSKVDDNAIGATGIFTLGATGVYLKNLKSEGSKGLVWLGNSPDNLYGTKNVFAENIFINDCKLFSFYIRGVEVPAVGFDEVNDTNNINILNLTIRGSNVGLVSAEGRPRNIKVINYDCQDTDNLLQIEKTDLFHMTNFHLSNSTSQWNASSPAPSKFQWQLSGSSGVSFVNGYIDAELQAYGFGISNIGCKNISFSNIKTGDFFICTTLNVQNGADANKGLFGNWSWDQCYLPKNGTSFFQSDVADQAGLPLLYWRNWAFSGCTWENDSASNPIVSVACLGSFDFDSQCNFNGKPPRALKGQKITFNATVRANGITGSDILFTAVPGLEATDQEILRLNCNVQVEGEVEDNGFDVVHDSGTYDSRNQAEFCRISNATEFNNNGASFYRFTGATGIDLSAINTYKSLSFPKYGASSPITGLVVADYLPQTFFDSSGLPDVYVAHSFTAGDWIKTN